MAWCRCSPKVSEFNIDVPESFGTLTLGPLDDSFVVSEPLNAGVDKKPQLTPIPPAEEDDYDPRKPEFLIQASPEEAGAKDADLIRQQMSQLKSMIARRREQTEGTPEKVFDHYEKVLEDLSHVLNSGEQGKKVAAQESSPRPRRRLFEDMCDEASPTKDAILARLPPSPARSGCGDGLSRAGTLGRSPQALTKTPQGKSHPSMGCFEGIASSRAAVCSQSTCSACPSEAITSPPIEGCIHLPRKGGHVELLPSPRPLGVQIIKPDKYSQVSCGGCAGFLTMPFSHDDNPRMLVRNVPASSLLAYIQEQFQNCSFAKLPFLNVVSPAQTEATKI